MKPNQKLCACLQFDRRNKEGRIHRRNAVVQQDRRQHRAGRGGRQDGQRGYQQHIRGKKKPKITSLSFEVTLKTETESVLVLFSEREGPEPRSEGGVSEEPQHGSEG